MDISCSHIEFDEDESFCPLCYQDLDRGGDPSPEELEEELGQKGKLLPSSEEGKN